MNENTCREQSFWILNGRHHFKFSATFGLFCVQPAAGLPTLNNSCSETTSSVTSLSFLTQAGGACLTKAKPLNF